MTVPDDVGVRAGCEASEFWDAIACDTADGGRFWLLGGDESERRCGRDSKKISGSIATITRSSFCKEFHHLSVFELAILDPGCCHDREPDGSKAFGTQR